MNHEIECPYCMARLNETDILYYLKCQVSLGGIIDEGLRKFLTPDSLPQEEDRFWQFWFGRENVLNAGYSNKRVIRTRTQILDLKTVFEKRTGEGESQTWQPGQNLGSRLEDVEEEASGRRSSCEIQQLKKSPDCYGFFENGYQVAVSMPACPSCRNVLPEEIFNMPVIRIALAAGPTAGKTCLLLSWFRSLDRPFGGLNGDPVNMSFDSLEKEDAGIPAYFDTMLKDFKDHNICPDGTKEWFIPPVFMKVNFGAGQAGSGISRALLGIYDAAGEVISYGKSGSLLIRYMAHMDGIIYLVDPDTIGISQGQSSVQRLIRSREADLFKGARVLDDPAQADLQAARPKSMTLGQLLQEKLGSSDEEENERRTREAQSIQVLVALKNYVPDEILRRQHAALAISKCDLLQDNAEVAAYDNGGLFFREEDPRMDRQKAAAFRAMRRQGLNSFFREKVFNLALFDQAFRDYSLHLIAPLGCGTRLEEPKGKDKDLRKVTVMTGDYKPIRIEEPLIDLISRIMAGRREDLPAGGFVRQR